MSEDNNEKLKSTIDFLKEKNVEKFNYEEEDNSKNKKIQKLENVILEQRNKRASNNAIEYPKQLADTTIETRYIGLLLNEIKAISVYYFLFDDCYFASELLLNIYKKIIFTDGEKFAPNVAREKFNFPRETPELYEEKVKIQKEFKNSIYKLDKTYIELKKIFILRKN